MPLLEVDEATRIREVMSRRNNDIMRRVSALDEQTARSILTQAVQTVPSLLFQLLESNSDNSGDDPPPERPPDTPEWCKCNNCRQMFTPLEEVCCDMQPPDCNARCGDFELLVLEHSMVQLAVRYRNDFFTIDQVN